MSLYIVVYYCYDNLFLNTTVLILEDILKEIRGLITFPQLGLVLNIEIEVIERTAQLFGGDEERALHHVVTNWLDNDPDASWEKLAKAVMRIPMLRQKGAQLYSKYVSKGYIQFTMTYIF